MRLAVAFGFFACCLSACSAPGRVRVEISPEEISSRLEASFPVTRDLAIAELELTEPEILLQEGADDLGLRLAVRVTIAVFAVEGTLAVKGKLRYQPEEAAFYLDEPEVRELVVPGLPEDHLPEIIEAINVALRTVLPRVAVHVLEEGPTRMFLRSVEVTGTKIIAVLGI